MEKVQPGVLSANSAGPIRNAQKKHTRGTLESTEIPHGKTGWQILPWRRAREEDIRPHRTERGHPSTKREIPQGI